MQATTEPTAAKPRKRSGAKAPERKGADRVRCTLILTTETDMKLSVLAMMRGLDRSALAEKVLAEAVRGVVISLRGNLSDTGEDRQITAA